MRPPKRNRSGRQRGASRNQTTGPPPASTAVQARQLILDLCRVAGDPDAVSAVLLRECEQRSTRDAGTVAMTLAFIVFTECLSDPVPVAEEATA